MTGLNTIMEEEQLKLTLKRLAHEIIENHYPFSNTCIIGIQPRGIAISDFITQYIQEVHPEIKLQYGKLDITFYRDDFRRRERPIIPSVTNIDFVIENKNVVLVDDVLYTGRTIRSGLDALLAFGRPKKVELLTLIDRRFRRDLPIQADYIGKAVDTLISERVSVEWKEIEGEDKIVLYTPEANG